MKSFIVIWLLLLTLSSCSTLPTAPFKDQLLGNWRIEMIKDQPVIDYSPASLQFDADNRLSGNASCNNMSSTYTLSDQALSLLAGAVTRKMCPGALMDQEARYLAALSEVHSGRVEQGMLYLEGASGELIFKASPLVLSE